MSQDLQPLISRASYEELQALRRRIVEGSDPDASPPFVAVGPTPSTTTGPRILFVGQCARLEETDGPDFEAAANWARRQLSTSWTGWAFWAFMLQAVARLLGETDNDKLRPHVGWTNVAKIGTAAKRNGSPEVSSQQDQADACARVLREEIETAQPHAIILVSGPYFGRPIVDTVFAGDAWTEWTPAGKAWFRTQTSPYAPVFWTYHPTFLRRRKSEAGMAQAIADWGSGLSVPDLR